MTTEAPSKEDIAKAKSLAAEGKIDEAMALLGISKADLDLLAQDVTAPRAEILEIMASMLSFAGSGITLANWPPSRGPKPPFLDIVQKYRFQKLTIRRCAPADVPPRKGKVIRFNMDYAVTTVAGLRLAEAFDVLRGVTKGRIERWFSDRDKVKALTTVIDYPLNVPAFVMVRPYKILSKQRDQDWSKATQRTKGEMDIGYFLWRVARAYQTIYKEHEKWGIWGHEIGDLVFEGLEYQPEHAFVRLLMGS